MTKYSNISAILLAGGKSTRMNSSKALLSIAGTPFIERSGKTLSYLFDEVIVSARSQDMFSFLPYQIVGDEQTNCGPLMGILSGLKASANQINFVIACDIPEINIGFIEKLIPFTATHEMVIPVTAKDRFEPLFAFYHKNLITHIEALLKQGIRKINQLFSKGSIRYVPMEDKSWYFNLNTKDDLQRYLNSRTGESARE